MVGAVRDNGELKATVNRRDGRLSRKSRTGTCIVATMFCYISFQAHAGLIFGVPWFQRGPIAQRALMGAIILATCNVYLDYIRLWRLGPGHPTPLPFTNHVTEAASAVTGSGCDGWCQRCSAPKPPRCHHCSTCGICVLKMDHHCVFIDGCVGLQNYSCFIFFLFDIFCAECICLLGILPQVPGVLVYVFLPTMEASSLASTGLLGSDLLVGGSLARVHLLVAAASGLVTLWAVGSFLIDHVPLILCNLTTIEDMEQRRGIHQFQRSAYDKGGLANVAEVFGQPPAWCRRPLERVLRALRWLLADTADPVNAKDGNIDDEASATTVRLADTCGGGDRICEEVASRRKTSATEGLGGVAVVAPKNGQRSCVAEDAIRS
eukprot:TRINITY_DN50617_c0_g1_i1.p1 TRINITY_DN50617_c0_g1~~TRINITY_DN50617_c0_g1_i1.p1  ORF type:complete len:377 (+),score=50.80 TRINITY_DN50617_c0_g1_i1:46-1176(+)